MSSAVKNRMSSHAGVDHCMHALMDAGCTGRYEANHGNVHYGTYYTERVGGEYCKAVFSYGTHWPMAIRVDKDTVLVNIRRRSVSTSRMTSAVRAYLHFAGFRQDEDVPVQHIGYESMTTAKGEFITYRRLV